MGHGPIFQASTLVLQRVSFDLSWSIVMFYCLLNVVCSCYVNKKMPRIANRRVLRRFNENQRRLLAFYLLITANWLERELWEHPFCLEACTKGEFFVTYPDLRKYPAKFFRTYRMSIRQFDNLLHLLRPVIEKQINNYRETISAEECLVITLR